jgi:hypothetical protein
MGATDEGNTSEGKGQRKFWLFKLMARTAWGGFLFNDHVSLLIPVLPSVLEKLKFCE